MAVDITIHDVSEEVWEQLAARAVGEQKTMEEFLKGELVRIARRPSLEALLQSVRKRKRLSPRRVSVSEILKQRDADRR
jgi:hypothetical protein